MRHRRLVRYEGEPFIALNAPKAIYWLTVETTWLGIFKTRSRKRFTCSFREDLVKLHDHWDVLIQRRMILIN